MGNDITIVKMTGWEGLYVNGILEGADFKVRISDLKAHLPISYIKEVYVNKIGENELKNLVGCFPRKFTDMPSTWFGRGDI